MNTKSQQGGLKIRIGELLAREYIVDEEFKFTLKSLAEKLFQNSSELEKDSLKIWKVISTDFVNVFEVSHKTYSLDTTLDCVSFIDIVNAQRGACDLEELEIKVNGRERYLS